MSDIKSSYKSLRFAQEATFDSVTASGTLDATNGLQVTEASISIDDAILDRPVLTNSATKRKPLQGQVSSSASFSVEAKGSGAIATEPDWGLAMECAFGTKTAAEESLTATSGTTTVVYASDTGTLAVGDIVAIIDQTDSTRECRYISALTNDTSFTVSPALSFTVSGTDTINKGITYKLTDTNPTGIICLYEGDNTGGHITTCAGAIGKVSIENIAAHEIATFKFDFEGCSSDKTITGGLPDDTYDSSIPYPVKGAEFKYSGTSYPITSFAASIDNTAAKKADCTATGGYSANIASDRKVGGSFKVYCDTANTTFFDDYQAGSNKEILFTWGRKTSGEFVAGETLTAYCPSVVLSKVASEDGNGYLMFTCEFIAYADTDNEEITLGLC